MRNDYMTGNATLDEEAYESDEEEEDEFEMEPEEVRVVAKERNLPKQLSKEELQRLDQVLPLLPSQEKAPPEQPGRGMLGQALQRKFQRLTQVPSRRRGL
mmetsp:Transcript_9308/g.21770  ORF Transcript_9308/g.21770 Transcript_9308/m.21770 type:complete len:100 (+) Transcript_9308:438-737(+)